MDRVTTKLAAFVMQAYADGKAIEGRGLGATTWHPCPEPAWNWSVCEFRVAPAYPDLIHWPALNERFEWIARDEDGKIFAFGDEPQLGQSAWISGLSHSANITNIVVVKKGGLPWTETKQRRPSEATITATGDLINGGELVKFKIFEKGLPDAGGWIKGALSSDSPAPPRR